MKRPKLLFLNFNLPYLIKDEVYPIGGATVALYGLIKGLIQNNCKVGVLTWRGAKNYVNKSVEFDIVETYRLNDGIRRIRWIYKIYPSLLKAIRNYNPDFLIQSCAGVETGAIGLISKKLNIPFIYRAANDMDADYRYKERLRFFAQIVYRYGLKMTDVIFCQNTYQYEHFKRQFPQKKIFIIHNPYSKDLNSENLKDRSKRRYIAWIGVFQYQKNLAALLEIAKALPSSKFKVAGKEGTSLDKETERALNDLRHCNNVSFVGYLNRKEILPFLSNAYALLNTSHYEGFSNTFLEAFSVGTPIVTTTRIDPDSIIFSNNLGHVGEKYSELPDLLTSVMSAKNYDEISKRCRRYVLENHDPRIIAKKFIDNLEVL